MIRLNPITSRETGYGRFPSTKAKDRLYKGGLCARTLARD